MEVRCAPTRAAPFTRRSMPTRKVTPKRLAISCASVIILMESARRPGSVATMSSVARVSALIGLKQRLPHSLSQNLAADVLQDRRVEAGLLQHVGEAHAALGDAADGLAEGELVAVGVPHHARLDDLGRGIDHAADRPLRPQRGPLPVVRIDAAQPRAGKAAVESHSVYHQGTPFCPVTTAVSGPSSGVIRSAASQAWCALRQTIT